MAADLPRNESTIHLRRQRRGDRSCGRCRRVAPEAGAVRRHFLTHGRAGERGGAWAVPAVGLVAEKCGKTARYGVTARDGLPDVVRPGDQHASYLPNCGLLRDWLVASEALVVSGAGGMTPVLCWWGLPWGLLAVGRNVDSSGQPVGRYGRE